MKRIARSLALKAANRDITIGLGTGIVLTAYRFFAFALFAARSPDPFSVLGGLLCAELCLFAACTIGVYQHRDAAAAGLASLYVLRFAFVWYVSGRAWPPISLVTIFVAYGLYRGVRGTAELAAMPDASVPDAAG
jgi:hypothetical protein